MILNFLNKFDRLSIHPSKKMSSKTHHNHSFHSVADQAPILQKDRGVLGNPMT